MDGLNYGDFHLASEQTAPAWIPAFVAAAQREFESSQGVGLTVDWKVKKFCAANKVDYSAGLKAVLQSNPKLAWAYVESTPLVKHESEASQAADADAE